MDFPEEMPEETIQQCEEIRFSLLREKCIQVYGEEFKIDPSQDIYLFTWSPDPDDLPDADFNTQHHYSFPWIAYFLECCRSGLACVESTQLGRPHYHGWYQIEPRLELARISWIKTLLRHGNYKVTKSLGYFKIGIGRSKVRNCLYYYKKDLIESMFLVDTNPVTRNSKSEVNWNLHLSLFRIPGRKFNTFDTANRISQKQYYANFYKNSGVVS